MKWWLRLAGVLGAVGIGNFTLVASCCSPPPVDPLLVDGECTVTLRTGFAGSLDWESAPGGGIGGGSDGDGGVGIGGALGQFRKATVVVLRADGTVLGSAVTGDDGLVTARLCSETGPLLVEILGNAEASYYDEGSLGYLPFPEGEVLRAFVPEVRRNIGITPFSDAAYQALMASLESGTGGVGGGLVLKAVAPTVTPTAAQIAAANERVRATLNRNLVTALQVDDITRLPAIVSDKTAPATIAGTPSGIYGLVNAGFSEQAAAFNPALQRPTIEALRQLRADLTDGKLDGSLSGTSIAGAASRSYDPARFATDLNVAIGAVSHRYGRPNALELLPAAAAYANCSYNNYQYDAQLSPDGRAYSRVQNTTYTGLPNSQPDTTIEPLKSVGQSSLLNPANVARVDAIYANMGSGALFAKGRGTSSRSSQLLGIGDNTGGELGNGNTALSVQLVPVPGVENPTHLAGGANHTLARLANGTVMAWGSNSGCALASTSGDRLRPAAVPLGATAGLALSVAAAGSTSYALTESGRVLAWGSNVDGSLGSGGALTAAPGISTCTPATVKLASGAELTDVVSLVARAGQRSAVAVALRRDGTVFSWGEGKAAATPVAGLPATVVKVQTEQSGYAALDSDGNVWFWGEALNDSELGPPAGGPLYSTVATPVKVSGLPTAVRDLEPGGYADTSIGVRAAAASNGNFRPRIPAMAADFSGRLWEVSGPRAREIEPISPAPVLSILDAATGDTLCVRRSGAECLVGRSTFTLAGTATGLGARDTIAISRNGTRIGTAARSTDGASWRFTDTSLRSGAYRYTVTVEYPNGARSAASAIDVRVDIDPPTSTTTLSAPLQSRGEVFVSGRLSAPLAADEALLLTRTGGGLGDDSLRLAPDSADWQTSFSIAGLSGAASFEFVARIVDRAGNLGPAAPSRIVLVDGRTALPAITAVTTTTGVGGTEVAVWTAPSTAIPSVLDRTPRFTGTLSAPLIAGEGLFMERCVTAPGGACDPRVVAGPITPVLTAGGFVWEFIDGNPVVAGTTYFYRPILVGPPGTGPFGSTTYGPSGYVGVFQRP